MPVRFIKSFATSFIVMFVILLTFIYFIDPLQYIRKASYKPIYLYMERYQLPALARTYDYDSVIVGTSHMQNVRPSFVKEVLGFSALNLSMSGATPYEQRLLLNIALNRGKVKNVIWGLDISYLAGKKVTQVHDIYLDTFPFYLYKHPLFGFFKYSLNKEVVLMSCEIFARECFGVKNRFFISSIENLDLYKNWHLDFKDVVNPKVLENIDKAQSSKEKSEFNLKETNHYLELQESINLKENLEKITEVISSHPDVNFFIFFPPYSITFLRNIHKDGALNVFLAQEFFILKELLKYKNVYLYGFMNREDIIMNLKNYKDITHYWQNISDEILVSLNKKDYRILSEEDIVKHIHETCRLVNKSNQIPL